jgi:hypothetical protein
MNSVKFYIYSHNSLKFLYLIYCHSFFFRISHEFVNFQDEDTGTEYVVQISQQPDEIGESDFDANEMEDEQEIEEEEEEEEDGLDQIDSRPGTSQPEPSISQINKRKRDDDHDDDDGDDDVDDLRSVRFRH